MAGWMKWKMNKYHQYYTFKIPSQLKLEKEDSDVRDWQSKIKVRNFQTPSTRMDIKTQGLFEEVIASKLHKSKNINNRFVRDKIEKFRDRYREMIIIYNSTTILSKPSFNHYSFKTFIQNHTILFNPHYILL